jgi:hypothetical protein
MAWVDKEWIAAWGENKPLIATDYDDALPKLPDNYVWMVTRHLVGSSPSVRVGIFYQGAPGRNGEGCCNIDYEMVDVKIDGEGLAVVGWAQTILDRNAEDIVPNPKVAVGE